MSRHYGGHRGAARAPTYHDRTVSGASEAVLFGLFVLCGLGASWYWWSWVGPARDKLPSWGIWVYIVCLVIGNAAGLAVIVMHYGT